jgi:hypothetical protein
MLGSFLVALFHVNLLHRDILAQTEFFEPFS